MKYANYYLIGNNVVNLGDFLILESKKFITRQIGISENDFLNISNLEIADYSGSPIVLNTHILMPELPKHITPCYIGFITHNKLNDYEIDHLKKHEPVSCRDFFTYQECIKNGIKAYFTGCTTAVLPKKVRPKTPKQKVFLIDLPEDAYPNIPEEIMENAVYATQTVSYQSLEDVPALYENYYSRIFNEARLVITPRLHCSIFCLNHGIPVVLMIEKYVSRMTTIDRLIPIYDKSRWHEIDFSPTPVCFSDSLREQMLNMAKSALLKVWHNQAYYANVSEIDSFYNKRPKNDFTTLDSFIESIVSKRLPNKTAKFNYSLWGASWWSRTVYDFLNNNYANAVLTNVYDAYKSTEFCGLQSKPLAELKSNIGSEICFVGCGEDVTSRIKMMKELEITEDSVVFINFNGQV